jgi:aldehyde:ferredoxin oxidoreductase
MLFIRWSNTMSCLPTKNFSQTTYELAEHIGGDYMEKRTKRGNKGCWGCPVRCGQLNRTEKISIEGPEYETTSMLGSNCGLRSLEDVIEVNWWCDQLGLDTISTGGVLAWAMECWERGLIDAKITGGVELKFGNKEAMVEMVKRIAHRKGFGHLLAEGVKRASQRIGKGSDRFAMHVKGLEISGYDHRAAPAMALAYLTADIGAHHNRAWAITIDIAKGRDVYGEEFEPDPAFAGVKNKIEWVIYLQHVRPLFDCLGHCRFHWLEFGVPLGFYPEVLEAATGLSYTLQELLRRSEAVWNLTRLISLRQGLKASDEQLPKRVFTDPIPCGPFKGYVLDKKKFRQMVQTYYRLRGWNEQGVPAREKLVELGLE